jgi:hypothetical protein
MRNATIFITLSVLLILGLILSTPRNDSPVSHPVVSETNPSPAPRRSTVSVSAKEAPLTDLAESQTNFAIATNLYERLVNGDFPKVSVEQLEPFLAKNNRSVEALLGALRASGDNELLKEAREKYPNDPRVQFAAAFKSDSSEERRQWFEKFKQSDPDNSLPNYLLAGEHLKAGATEQALLELTAAGGKRNMENYLVDFIQNAEEAYRAAGYSDAESKAVAGTSALLPEQAKLKQVGVDLVDLAKRYQQAGDNASAQAALQMGLSLAHRLDQSPQVTLIQELVGMAIERKVLDAMSPNAVYGDTGRTVKEQLDALTARRNSYKELTTKTDPILKTMSDDDLAHYFDRIKVYGDAAALRWVMNQSSH